MMRSVTPNKFNRELHGFLALIVTTFMYGFWGILVRKVNESESPIFVQSAVRSIVIAIILALIALLSKRAIQWPEKKGLVLYGVRSLIGMTSFTLGYFAFVHLPVATVYIYFYTGFVVGGFLMGKWIYKEDMSGVKYLSLVFAILGVTLNYYFEAGDSISANLYTVMALTAGVFSSFWSAFPSLLPKHATDIESGLFDSIFAIIIAIVLTLVVSDPIVLPGGVEWVYQGLFIFVAIVAGQLTIFGFKRIEAQIGSIVMLLEIVFGSVIGMIVFSEMLKWYTILGGVLIIIGSSLPIIYDKMRVKNTS